MLDLAFLLACSVPPTSDAVRQDLVLSRLDRVEARRLAGRRIRCVVEIDSPESDMPDGSVGYECVSADAASRCVWLRPGQDVPASESLTVEGVLRVMEHRPSVGADGTRFEEFTEYRLMDGRVIRPGE